MSEEATGTPGVSTDAVAVEQPKLSDRDQKMAEIKAKRTEMLENEHQEAIALGIAVQKTDADTAEVVKQPEALESDAPVFKKDGKWFTKIKVDGKEKEVAFDSVIRTVQKSDAVDVRLHQAGEVVRGAEAKAKAIIEKAVQDASQRRVQPSSDGDVADGDFQAIADKITNELLEGDPKASAKLLAQTLGRIAATPQVQPANTMSREDVIATVFEIEDHKAKVSAVSKYRQDYPELAKDSVLNTMVDAESALVMADEEFRGASYGDMLSEAANRVKAKIAAVIGHVETPATTDRQQRKVAASNPGVGVAARRPVPQPPQPKTPQQKIAEMRLARGQA